MRQLLFILLLCLCQAPGLHAQLSGLKLFDYPQNDRQGLFELSRLPNGNVLMFGHHFAAGDTVGRGGLVMEIDAGGNLVGSAYGPAGDYAQIKDALINPDGSNVLLAGRLDVVDFQRRMWLLFRDAEGRSSFSMGYLGDGQAITRAADGGFMVVGRQRGTQGTYATFDASGRATGWYKLLPEVRRPAALLDVITLAEGDFVALGYITTPVGGVAQSEITLLRFTPSGDLRWAKKITRGDFFTDDRMTMSIRAPIRIQVDAEENLYFNTYLGRSGRSWRPHLLKLSSEGELIHSTAYTVRDSYAGQGALSVDSDGTGVLCFETIHSEATHGLTSLRIAPGGEVESVFRRYGAVFDVSSVLSLPGGGHFITGTTLDCTSDRRITYLSHLHTASAADPEDCDRPAPLYSAADVPVLVVPFDVEVEPVPIVAVPALGLEPVTINTRTIDCVSAEPVDTVLYLCSNSSVTYDPGNIGSLAQVRWRDTESNDPNREFSAPGRFALQLTYDCIKITQTVTVLPAEGPPAPPEAITRRLCGPDETTTIDLGAWPDTAVRWSTGDTGPTIRIAEAGVYTVTLTGPCSEATSTVTVEPAGETRFSDELLQQEICHGDSLQIELPIIDGATAAFLDYPEDTESITVRESGTVRIVQSDGCTEGVLDINVVSRNCCKVFLPTAFSPNGDGVNDRYAPAWAREGCSGVGEAQLKIYDRWGSLVHHAQGGESWDGQTRGKPAAAGSYVAVLTYLSGPDVNTQSQGITLLR